MAKIDKRPRGPRVLEGVAASPGIAVGPLRRVEELAPAVEARDLRPEDVEAEAARFRAALSQAQEELAELRRATARDIGEDEARIFDVQILVLQDPMVVDRTEECIRRERKSADFLFSRHVLEVSDHLEGLSDAYFSQRAVDLHDVRRRVLRHLAGVRGPARSDRPVVLVGRELAPSDAVHLNPDQVLGFATELGGATSHASIMARARGIPAVVGVRGLAELVGDDDVIAVDGIAGKVYLDPAPATLEWLRTRRRAYARLQKRREGLVRLPAETRDGRPVRLTANMEIPEELEYILGRGGEGIGLFRTEFFFMLHHRAPSEEEQYDVYRRIAESFGDRGVIVRALDVGGDKFAAYLGILPERNPFLGMRGVRFLLARPEVLATQLRAILRAGAHGKLRILIPMVSSVDELEAVREHVRRVLDGLRRARVPHDHHPELGVMIEVPSAVVMVDEFARRADFLSIGTNDLIQYTLAIERDHEVLHHLYQPLHPAILRSLRLVVEAGRRHGKPVSVCGEMAGDPSALPLLLGLGVENLSVSPYLLPEVKQSVRALRLDECRELAEDALRCLTSEEVATLVRDRLGSRYSALLTLAQNQTEAARRPSAKARSRGPRTRDGA